MRDTFAQSLVPWSNDLVKRSRQLAAWSATLQLPFSLWLPGLFNPGALVTAVMQVAARASSLPLDNMTTEVCFACVIPLRLIVEDRCTALRGPRLRASPTILRMALTSMDSSWKVPGDSYACGFCLPIDCGSWQRLRRWCNADDDGKRIGASKVGKTDTFGELRDARPKELLSVMPVSAPLVPACAVCDVFASRYCFFERSLCALGGLPLR